MTIISNRLVFGLAFALVSSELFSEQIVYGLDSARQLRVNSNQTYYIQLGGFTKKANAERFLEKQRALLGNHVILRKVGHYYSVGIAPSKTKDYLGTTHKKPIRIVKVATKAESKMGVIEKNGSGFLPVYTIAGGIGLHTINQKAQSYTGSDDNVFQYYSTKGNDGVGMGGIFIGLEHPLQWPGFFMQGGLELNAFSQGNVKGDHLVGIEPGTSTLYHYRYGIKTQQLLAVAKFFSTFREIYHPNLSVGLGGAFNRATSFSANAAETGSINLTAQFGDHTQSALSYSLGLGMDADISQRLRLGLGYRFSDIGKTSLGMGTVGINDYKEITRFTINSRNNYMNLFMAQLSYLLK